MQGDTRNETVSAPKLWKCHTAAGSKNIDSEVEVGKGGIPWTLSIESPMFYSEAGGMRIAMAV